MRDMKKAIAKVTIWVIISALILVLAIPTAIVGLLGKGGDDLSDNSKNEECRVKIPEEIRIWRTDSGRIETVIFEEYICCVVASEMPSSFHKEALKAQSVAARTYAMAKVIKYDEKHPAAHEESPICDSTHCQVYKTEKELSACHSGDWMESEEGFLKVKEACEETEGELLYYKDSLVMQPLFFSSSGGYTENSEDVFAAALPYLVSVPSPYEEKATHQNESKSMGIEEFETAMRENFPTLDFGPILKDNIEILSRTDGGRVDEMQVGNCQVKGTEVRNAVGLSSAMFSVDFEKVAGGVWKVVFTSNGFGHGVGMSQYGADGMAKEGYEYKEILSHYYTGTKVY